MGFHKASLFSTTKASELTCSGRGVALGVGVIVLVGVGVGGAVGVFVGSGVRVAVLVAVGKGVRDGFGVVDGLAVGEEDLPDGCAGLVVPAVGVWV